MSGASKEGCQQSTDSRFFLDSRWDELWCWHCGMVWVVPLHHQKREEEEAIAVLQRSTAPPMAQNDRNSTTRWQKERENPQNHVSFSITAYDAKDQAGKCNNLQSTRASEWILKEQINHRLSCSDIHLLESPKASK